jgi:nicotinamide-nucleotide amidase
MSAPEETRTVEGIAELLMARSLQLGVAESLTGGMLSERFAQASQSSSWFRGGVVAYASEVKYDVLGVPVGPVVSEVAARQMAVGVAQLLKADVSVALTGVGGPDEQDGQPPGTVWVGTVVLGDPRTRLFHFRGGPGDVCEEASSTALQMLTEHLTELCGESDQVGRSASHDQLRRHG